VRRIARLLFVCGFALGGWGVSGYLPAPAAPVQPRLRIHRLGLDVAIYPDDSEESLRRGAGHIRSTAAPGAPGNAALAGHRDTHFRPLERLRRGDRIQVDLGGERILYEVAEIQVVAPERVDVLAPQPRNSLTLVTCYPFRFAGPAPQRFVVHAPEIARLRANPDRLRNP
jgi:sortase A